MSSLVLDQFGVVACVEDEEVDGGRVFQDGSARQELVQIQRLRLIIKRYFCLEVIKVGIRFWELNTEVLEMSGDFKYFFFILTEYWQTKILFASGLIVPSV